MSDWTTDTTRDSLLETLEQRDRLWEERDRRYMAEFGAIREATKLALASVDRRLEGMNEFRASLADQSANMMQRSEATAKFDALAEKITEVNKRLDLGQGTGAGSAALRQLLFQLVGAASTVVGLYFLLKG